MLRAVGVVVTVVVAFGAAALWSVRRRYAVVTVRGVSMEPSFHEGDRVVVRRSTAAHHGEVVVVEQPDGVRFDQVRLWSRPAAKRPSDRLWMIKRVRAVSGDPVPGDIPVPDEVVPPGQLVLLGDNADASYDSRVVGYFPVERVLGGVVRRLG